MLLPDNPWMETWGNAQPVPANRQRRLFDDTREAEKILHFLESRTLSQIADLLVPVIAQASICRLSEALDLVINELPESKETLDHIHKTVMKLSREGNVNLRRYELLAQEISQLELAISQASSVCYKLNPSGTQDEAMTNFTKELLQGKEVEIQGQSYSDIGQRMIKMFSEAQKSVNMVSAEGHGIENRNTTFPQPFEREFVMKVMANRPAISSAKSPQFLRACLSKNEFRLSGAFSEDIVFF